MNSSIIATGALIPRNLLRPGSSTSIIALRTGRPSSAPSCSSGLLPRQRLFPQHHHQQQHTQAQQLESSSAPSSESSSSPSLITPAVRPSSAFPLAYQQGSSKALKEKAKEVRSRAPRQGGSGRRRRTPPGRRTSRSRRGRQSNGAAVATSPITEAGPAGNSTDEENSPNQQQHHNNTAFMNTDSNTSIPRGRAYVLQEKRDALLSKQKELETSLTEYRESLDNGQPLSQTTALATSSTTLLSTTKDDDDSLLEGESGPEEMDEEEMDDDVSSDDDDDDDDDIAAKERRRSRRERSNQATALIARISDLHASVQPHSWKHVEETEEGYRQLCRRMDETMDLVTTVVRLSSKDIRYKSQGPDNVHQNQTALLYYSGISEGLLEAWIKLQQDRRDFVQAAKDLSINNDDDDDVASGSWFGWLNRGVLGQVVKKADSNTDDDDSANNIDSSMPLLAHEDPLYGPQLEHFQNLAEAVISTLLSENMQGKTAGYMITTPFHKLKRAQRLKQLLEKMPENVVPDENAINSLMMAFTTGGSYESAQACESLAKEYPEMNLLETVLHGYYRATRFSQRNQEKTKSATRAYELLRERLENSPSDFSDEDKLILGIKVLLNFRLLDREAMPLVCKYTDVVSGLCLGRENQEDIFRNGNLESIWKLARPQVTFPFLNCLVVIYATNHEGSLHFAKRLLMIILKDSDFQADKDLKFPNIRTIQVVMTAMVTDFKKRLDAAKKKGNKPTREFELLQEAFDYGFELLSLMKSHPDCWPDETYFHYLFKVLLMKPSKDSGAIAEQLMSKMHIHECMRLPGFNLVTKKIYDLVLLAWRDSAKRKCPGAAKKSLVLLDSMEAQSTPLFPEKDNAYKDCVAPDRSTFELALHVCLCVKIPEEKEEALDCALAIYDRLKKRGIRPNSETYNLLFGCCTALLPESSKRRQSVTEKLLEDARTQGHMKESVLRKVQNRFSSGSSAGGAGTSKGLLADFKGLLADLD